MHVHRRVVMTLAAMSLLAACNGTGTQTTESPPPTATPTATATASPAASGMDDEAVTRVADAAAATAEQGTVRFEMTIETQGTAGEDGTQPLGASGAEDFDAEQRQITFSGTGGELDMIVDGTDVYVQLPATEETTWARIELESVVSGEVGFGGPAGLPFRSPRDNLAALTDAVTAAGEAGEEDLDGEATTRYDLTIDLEQAADQAAEGSDTWSAVAEQSGVTELTMQVWIDDDDLIRRIAYSLDLSQAQLDAATEDAEVEADPQGTVTVTVDYSEFGTPVDIELPDDDDIVDVDEDEIRDSLQAPGSATGTATETSS